MNKCFCERVFKTSRSFRSHKRFCVEWKRLGTPKHSKHLALEERKKIPSNCPICKKEFSNVYKMNAHKGHCMGITPTKQFDGKRGWNRGFTKYTHPSVLKTAISLSFLMKGKPGHKWSLEQRNKQSLLKIKFLETHPNRGVLWYEIEHDGVFTKVQGTWEKQVAEFLTCNNITWERRTLKFCKTHRYTPDFYLPEYDFYIEVKGFWKDRDIHKMYLVLDEHSIDIRFIDKTNINCLTLDLPKFTENFIRSNIDENKFKNIWGM